MRGQTLKFSEFKGLLFLIALLLLWEIIGQLEFVQPADFFPPVTAILNTLAHLTASLELPVQLGYTLLRSITGLFIACMIGIPIGVWMGYSKLAREVLGPTVEVLRPIPPAAIIPVAILFFGIHDPMKLVVIIFGCIWPILINSIAGVRDLDRVLLDTGRSFHLKGWQFFWEIILKGALPYIVTGVRISLAISLILAIVTEMIAGNNGLGYFIIISERSFELKEMYAGLFAIALVGYFLNKSFVAIINRYLMRWYQGYTTQL